MRRGCGRGFAAQHLAQEAQKWYKPGHTLASTVLKGSVAAGSSWPGGGAKGKACTLKLNTRSPKLFKIFESGVLERWEKAWRGLLLEIPPGPQPSQPSVMRSFCPRLGTSLGQGLASSARAS